MPPRGRGVNDATKANTANLFRPPPAAPAPPAQNAAAALFGGAASSTGGGSGKSALWSRFSAKAKIVGKLAVVEKEGRYAEARKMHDLTVLAREAADRKADKHDRRRVLARRDERRNALAHRRTKNFQDEMQVRPVDREAPEAPQRPKREPTPGTQRALLKDWRCVERALLLLLGG